MGMAHDLIYMKSNLTFLLLAAAVQAGCVGLSEPTYSRTKAESLRVNPFPRYPAESARAGEEGTVVLRVLVDESGNPAKVELKQSSGSTRLDEQTVDAIRRWQFVSARLDDKPIADWVEIPIRFRLAH